MAYDFVRVVNDVDHELIHTIVWIEEGCDAAQVVRESLGSKYRVLLQCTLPDIFQETLQATEATEETECWISTERQDFFCLVQACREFARRMITECEKTGFIAFWLPAAFPDDQRCNFDAMRDDDGIIVLTHDSLRHLIIGVLGEELETLSQRCIAAPMN